MINFKDPYSMPLVDRTTAVMFLYQLLDQRPATANVSHKAMPTLEEHTAFVAGRPYRYWYLITRADTGDWVGSIYATDNNELGIQIAAEHQRKGYAIAALQTFIRTHKPRQMIRGLRNGNWLANVAIDNDISHNLFHRLGKPIQVTYEIQPCA